MIKAEDLLKLASDMEQFSENDDELSSLISSSAGDELDIDDLDSIAAAASIPDYSRFLRLREERRNK